MTNKSSIKPIPYGVTDFNEFKKENLYYIDKTRFIRNIEEKGQFLFFIRPRRFGKSLLLGILEAYYDVHYKDQFDFFFEGTDIHQNPTHRRNSFTVLNLNFSGVNSDPNGVEEAFLNYIKDSTSFFVKKYSDLLNIDIESAYQDINSKKSASEVMISFLKYCREKEYKLYVIIDEYDNFANTILTTSGEEKFKDITHGDGFLRSFFNVLKAGTTGTNAPIARLFISGVLPITLDGLTSGFNIGKHVSLDSDLNEMLGLTREEVIEMIEYYRKAGKIRHSTEELIEMMSQWYGHYRFSPYADIDIFDTSHVLYFFTKYMVDGEIPLNMIDSNAQIDYHKLRHLIIVDKKNTSTTNGNFSMLNEVLEKGELHYDIEESFTIEKLNDPENLISLLYYFGLLTIAGIDEKRKPILIIPNEMCKRILS